MRKVLLSLFLVIVVLFCVGCSSEKDVLTNEARELLQPGEVFEPGTYIEFEGVQILYNGESFICKNNRSDMIRLSCSIVGVKKDGSYDVIQLAGFSGVDETQYERDKSENGWAVEKQTNLIRPNETLNAKLNAFDFNEYDSEQPKNDIDNDGYLDIIFTISPQVDEKTIISSTEDYKSEVYKIKDK